MNLWVQLALIAGAVILLVIALQALFRPRYLVTVQKTTNSASQPEIVTIQANLPWWASALRIWETLEEYMAMPATARMVTVNEHIIATNKKVADEIAARRPLKLSKLERRLDKARKKAISRQLGIPISDVKDEMVQAAVAAGANGGASEGA